MKVNCIYNSKSLENKLSAAIVLEMFSEVEFHTDKPTDNNLRTVDVRNKKPSDVWEAFFRDVPRKSDVIEYIEDPEKYEGFTLMCNLMSIDIGLLKVCLSSQETVVALFCQGNGVIMNNADILKDEESRQYRLITVAGNIVPIQACTYLAEEVGGIMQRGYPFSVTYRDTRDGRIFTFMSNKKDVSEIAAKYGGGGRKNLATCKVFYNDKRLKGWL